MLLVAALSPFTITVRLHIGGHVYGPVNRVGIYAFPFFLEQLFL